METAELVVDRLLAASGDGDVSRAIEACRGCDALRLSGLYGSHVDVLRVHGRVLAMGDARGSGFDLEQPHHLPAIDDVAGHPPAGAPRSSTRSSTSSATTSPRTPSLRASSSRSSTVDPEVAEARGVPIGGLAIVFLLTMTAAVAEAVQVVGVAFARSCVLSGILLALVTNLPVSVFVTSLSFAGYLLARFVVGPTTPAHEGRRRTGAHGNAVAGSAAR